MKPIKRRLGWTRPDTEDEYEIEVKVYPGSPGTGPSYSSGGDPPEPPEVEVLAVADYEGNARPDLVEAAQADVDSFYATACEAAQDYIDGLAEDAADRALDSRHEWGMA